ncbi:MAG: hypothetical protein M3069_24690, partial [Chloroflexota bacterium]|nr:hypothetical protein [Chloroflexota bacterium]
SFGDVKGLDTWTFFPSALASTTLNIVTNSTLSGHVFSDPNGNGTQDAGEPNLSGLAVTITTSAGGTLTTTTDASGNYSATVPNGSTIAGVAGPAGATLTTANNPQTVSVPAGATGSATPVGFQPAPPTSTPNANT